MTKTLKPLRKHYEHLDARERYRLIAQAKERGDDDEINRLIDTCPYEEGVYRIRDQNFVHMYERSLHLCAVFTECFTEALYKVALLILAHPDDHAFKDNTNSRRIRIREQEGWTKECDAIKKRVGELKALYGALRKFCNEAGLEMGDILCWNPNTKERIMLAKGYLELPIEADQTFLDALHRGFRSIWTGKSEAYPDPYTEEEIERYRSEFPRNTEGYDSVDLNTPNNPD